MPEAHRSTRKIERHHVCHALVHGGGSGGGSKRGKTEKFDVEVIAQLRGAVGALALVLKTGIGHDVGSQAPVSTAISTGTWKIHHTARVGWCRAGNGMRNACGPQNECRLCRTDFIASIMCRRIRSRTCSRTQASRSAASSSPSQLRGVKLSLTACFRDASAAPSLSIGGGLPPTAATAAKYGRKFPVAPAALAGAGAASVPRCCRFTAHARCQKAREGERQRAGEGRRGRRIESISL